ncbi:MAG TPA: TonB family protein [Thermoanaerobaculia bacterium]|nr:TonB family protein [Thermoanaerobaculia bacterium]
MALLDEHIEGKYEILEKLREGGMGAIYKVRHRLLDELRVVKVIRANLESPDAGDRFLREARVAIRLRHPNIAQLHDFAIAADGNAYIVMELINGSTLQEILKRHGPPPIPLSLEIARQAVKALGYLHRQKIVHRDVSPDNLMLTRDADGHPLVKLIDLGIAKAFEGAGGLTTTGIFLGKPRYASPEQFGGTGLDARSDLYSFGVVLYELLTGCCPISGNDPASFMAGHLLRPPLAFSESDPEGKLPPALRELLFRTLTKEPAQRIGSAEELLWALTMVQDQFEPATTADLEAVLAALPEVQTETPVRPGSTQNRLDHEFWMTQTPPPAARVPLESPGATIVPPLGSSLAESVKTQRLPGASPAAPDATAAGPNPTRILPMLDGEAAKTRVTPLSATEPARTLEAPLRPSVLDDLTWVTTRTARPTSTPPPVIAAPPAQATEPVSGRSPKAALIAGGIALALLAGGAGVWRLTRKPVPEPPPPAAASQPPEVVVPPAAAPVSVNPSPEPAASKAPGATEEFGAAAKAAKKDQSKKIVTPDPSAAPPPKPADLAPMQRGDLILRGLPNVEEPEAADIPRYSYPAAAHGSGKSAKVRVSVLVDENGKVANAVIKEGDSSGLGFNEAALEAARKVPFAPATRDGIPGKMWTELIFEFAE